MERGRVAMPQTPALRTRPARVGAMRSREGRTALLMLAPALGFLGLMTAITLSYLVWTSMLREVRGVERFVGLGNYASVAGDPALWDALARSVVFVVVAVGAEIILGLGLAMLLRQSVRGAGVARSAIIVPMMVAPVVAGLIWRTLYDPSFGTLNYFMSMVGVEGPAWLGSASLALPALIIVDIWQWTPFVFLVLLAGLSSLPDEPVEAALVDGAGSWQVLRYVTLPALMPIIDLVVLIRALDALKTFDTIYTLTQGGPGRATETIVYYDYLTGFRWFEFGKASAIAVLLLVMTIVAANVYVRVRHVRMVETV